MGNHRKYLIIAFLLFLILHLIIFRGLLVNSSEIISGDKIVTSDELIPFFDFQTQFFDQLKNGYSNLTGNDEIRIGYSFPTTWMRYYTLLPFSLVILSTLSVWLVFLSFFLLLRRVGRGIPNWQCVLFSATPALVIHSVIMYSKITQFYTLIFGFGIFSLSISLLILALYDSATVNKKYLILSAILVLVNPGIHYHVLFYIVLIPVLLGYLAGVFRIGWSRMGRDLLSVCSVYLIISAVPYLLFVYYFILGRGTDVAGSIPVIYSTIVASSPSLVQILCMDIAGILNNFLYGSPMLPNPRTVNFIYFIFALFPLLFERRLNGEIDAREKNLRVSIVLTLCLMLIISVWLSLGYSEGISFHRIFSSIAPSLYTSDSTIAQVVLYLMSQAVQILRFPHRFQFLGFYALGALIAISLYLMYVLLLAQLRRRMADRRLFKAAMVILAALVIVPVMASRDYRTVFSSGNFGGFLEPYAVTEDLKQIKGLLQQDNEDYRILVLPSVGGGLRVQDENNNIHILHDKFYIYYFNKASLDYAQSGSLESKQQMFLLYRAFQYKENWWINVLRNNDVKYVVLNKEVVPRPHGTEYLPGISEKIKEALISSLDMETIYIGDRYMLFKVKDFDGSEKKSLLLDVDWKTYIELMKTRQDLFKDYRVYHTFDFDIDEIGDLEELTLMYSNESKAALDWQVMVTDGLTKPDTNILPFSSDLTPSTKYSENMFGLFNLLGTNNAFQMVIPGMFDTLNNTFVGTDTRVTIKFPLRIKEPGTYAIYLRGKYTDNRLKVDIDGFGEPLNLNIRAVSTEWEYLFEYGYEKVWEGEMIQGSYPIQLEKMDNNPMIIDGIVAVKVHIPSLDDLPVKLISVSSMEKEL